MKQIAHTVLCLTLAVLSALCLFSCGKGNAAPKLIGVQSATTSQLYVDGDADWEYPGITGFSSKGYSSTALAVQDMKNGAVRYVLADREPALKIAGTISGVKVVDVPLTEEEYAFGVDKNQPELLASVNAILAEMKENGAFDAIVKAYATGEGIQPVTSAVFDKDRADAQLVVATNAEFAPFEYKDGDQFAGIDMEIAAYIARELGMELVIRDMAFSSVVTSVGSHGVDLAMAGLTVSEERKQSIDFTDPYYTAAQVLIVPESNTLFDACKTAEDVLGVLASEEN